MSNYKLTAKIVNDNRVDGIGKYSTKDLKTASETLSGMIDFMNLTGNNFVVMGLVMAKCCIDNVTHFRS